MDSLAVTKIFYALIILSITVVSGFLPLFNSDKRFNTIKSKEYIVGEALSSGVFLGAGLLHMLSDSAHNFYTLGYHYPIAFLLAGIVFLVLLFLEHVGRELNEHSGSNNLLFVIIAVLMLSIHSLFEGIALGIRTDLSLIIIVFIAILAHKWAASYSLAIQIRKSNISLKLSWLLFLIFAFMTPVGILLGNFINSDIDNNILVPIFTALAAGTFLYIGTLHGLNRAVMVDRCCNLYDYLFVIIGFMLMAIIGIWV